MTKFISFFPTEIGFSSSFFLGDFIFEHEDIDAISYELAKIYEDGIKNLKELLNIRKEMLLKKQRIPAVFIWDIGDQIFRINNQINSTGFQIDDYYSHLERDLGISRKWLEKVIILRRYINDKNTLPQGLSWGYFEKGTKHKAIKLKEMNCG